jgi:nucleoside-diphosphate-sugar epimerase
MKKLAIIGAGWLGKELGKSLRLEGYSLLGTTRSAKRKKELESLFDQVELFDIEVDRLDYNSKEWAEVDVFILTIPPSAIENYAEVLNSWLESLQTHRPEALVIYTSSVSVYGSSERVVSEESMAKAETDNARKIVVVENSLLQKEVASIVLRLGGLIGPKRHPVYFLSGRKELKGGEAGVNLVHSEDVARVLHFLLSNNIHDGLFNVCSPEHPLKKEFYPAIARSLKLAEPSYRSIDKQKDKVVLCHSLSMLQFQFKYNSPFDYPI